MSGEESPLIGDGAGYSSINNSTFTSPKLRPISTSSNNTAISEISKYLHSDLTKSIGRLGSFILLTNNITGPAMMSLPNLFNKAGIIPVILFIIFVCVSTSLCVCMLADTLSSYPGNKNFAKSLDFSTACHISIGSRWAMFVETLFLISCGVQACAGIVETSQSLDGFLSSFLLGNTYAVQFVPEFKLIAWSPKECKGMDELIESSLESCTPFNDDGPLILSLGFLLTAVLFLPLGRGHLKETITVQFISFMFLVILLSQFLREFIEIGLHNGPPLFGDDFSQLAGVILFNFAYSITVPAWLMEKKTHVSVNRTVWSAGILSSILYIAFGLLGAMSFQQVGPNLLVLLASKKVHMFTRVCSALFGVSIIGAGIPIFCVVIKDTLIANGVTSKGNALFWGALAPYCLSWLLYQGSLLMTVLNWTGLVVNGLVAFILPLILILKVAYYGAEATTISHEIVLYKQDCDDFVESQEDVNSKSRGAVNEDVNIELIMNDIRHSPHRKKLNKHREYLRSNNNTPIDINSGQSVESPSQKLNQQVGTDYVIMQYDFYRSVRPLPEWLEPFRIQVVTTILVLFTIVIVCTLIFDAVDGLTPD